MHIRKTYVVYESNLRETTIITKVKVIFLDEIRRFRTICIWLFILHIILLHITIYPSIIVIWTDKCFIEVYDELSESCCGNIEVYQHMYQQRHRHLMKANRKDLADNVSDTNNDSEIGTEYSHSTAKTANYVVHRIRFIHYYNYLNALLQARVVLDTFPYGGRHFTTCDLL